MDNGRKGAQHNGREDGSLSIVTAKNNQATTPLGLQQNTAASNPV